MKFQFLNKIIALLILVFLFAPLLSNAIMILPSANLTIVVNTEGSDTSFNFNLEECPSAICNSPNQINLQTQNLTVSTTQSINAFAGETFYLDENSVPGLKVDNIICTSDNPSNTFLYQQNAVSFLPHAWSNIICIFNNKKVKTPVLIVPGIMGTEMKNGSELLWADISRMLGTGGDAFMDPLAFNKDLTPINSSVSYGEVLKNPSNLFDYTEGLVNQFIGQDYKENENLFLFPYDWRYGVSGRYADGTTNVDLLKSKIEQIIAQTGAEKIDVVAHSNGGLLVKKYVMDNAASHKIDKAVFVGVPNTGAPKAVKALLQGDNMGVYFGANLGVANVAVGLNEAEMKKISENMPVAYDLLPSQRYYDIKNSFIRIIDYNNPLNPFDNDYFKFLTYSQSKDFLINEHGLNQQALTNSENLHTQDFDNYDLKTSGVNLYNIVGCKQPTLTQVVETKYTDIWGKTTIGYDTPEINPGDGTVPLESATNLPIDQENKFYALASDHGKMPSQEGIRQQIVNLVAGSNLSVDNKIITQDIAKCQLNGKAISVFSPVDILITDQNGNKLGLAEDKSVINQIPGADFEVWGEHKFIFVPTDDGQTYSINLTGTGTGTFTIKSQDIAGTLPGKIENFINISVTTELTGQINLGTGENQTTLTLKQNPGAETQVIYPSSTLTAEQLNDFALPISTVTLNGEKDSGGIYTGQVKVEINTQDPIILGKENQTSGVLNVNYNLDDLGYKKSEGNAVDFTVSAEGKHKVTYYAVDKNGNIEIEKNVEFEIKIPVVPEVATLPVEVLTPPVPIIVGGGVGGVNMQKIQPVILPAPEIVKPEIIEPVKKILKPAVVKVKKPEVVVLESEQNKLPVALTVVLPQAQNQQKINPFMASLSITGKWMSTLLSKLFFWK